MASTNGYMLYLLRILAAQGALASDITFCVALGTEEASVLFKNL